MYTITQEYYYINRLFERGEINNMIIAIDGAAGSGKSSTAKKVAFKLGFNYEFRVLIRTCRADFPHTLGWRLKFR